MPPTGHPLSPREYLDLRQLQDFWENADVVGMCDQSVQPLTVCDGRGDGFEFVATQVQFLQLLQFIQLAETETPK